MSGIARVIERLDEYEESLYEATLQIVRHIITAANCIPTQELAAVSKLLYRDISLQMQLIICRTLNEIVAHDASYRDTFRVNSDVSLCALYAMPGTETCV